MQNTFVNIHTRERYISRSYTMLSFSWSSYVDGSLSLNCVKGKEAGCPRERGLPNYASSGQATKHSSVIIDCRQESGSKCPILISILHLSCLVPSIHIMYTCITYFTPVEPCHSMGPQKKTQALGTVYLRETNILLLRSEINGNPCRGWRGCLFLSFLLCFNWTEANTHHLTLWRQSSTIRGLLFLRFLLLRFLVAPKDFGCLGDPILVFAMINLESSRLHS